MRKILIIIIIITLIVLLFLKLINLKEIPHKQRVKDYSDVKVTKYTLQEWEDLGLNVWKKYYSPKRWKEIKSKSSLINNYEDRWKRGVDFVLKEKGLVKDKEKIEIWAKPLSEEIVPIHGWFWSDRKIRMLFCEYTIVHDGKKLRTYPLNLPATEGSTVEK